MDWAENTLYEETSMKAELDQLAESICVTLDSLTEAKDEKSLRALTDLLDEARQAVDCRKMSMMRARIGQAIDSKKWEDKCQTHLKYMRNNG